MFIYGKEIPLEEASRFDFAQENQGNRLAGSDAEEISFVYGREIPFDGLPE